MKRLEWRHQVQKEELKRPVVGFLSDFTELCRQGQNRGGVGSLELCVYMVARPETRG